MQDIAERIAEQRDLIDLIHETMFTNPVYVRLGWP